MAASAAPPMKSSAMAGASTDTDLAGRPFEAGDLADRSFAGDFERSFAGDLEVAEEGPSILTTGGDEGFDEAEMERALQANQGQVKGSG